MAQSKNINWTGSNVGYYEIQFKKSSDAVWSTPSASPVLGTSYTLAGLDDNTSYVFRVRGVCNGVITSWLNTDFITGSSTCAAATNLAVANITSTTAKISWNPATGATGYIVKYKKNSDSEWSVNSITTNTNFQLTFLTALTAYNVEVVTICSAGKMATSNPYNFSTI